MRDTVVLSIDLKFLRKQKQIFKDLKSGIDYVGPWTPPQYTYYRILFWPGLLKLQTSEQMLKFCIQTHAGMEAIQSRTVLASFRKTYTRFGKEFS